MTGALSGKRILVTGGATGIGAAAVQVLSAAGARVAATFHHTAPPDRSDATWLQCDATDTASVDQTVHAAVDALHGLDVLVHAAGLWHPGVPGQLGVDDVRHIMDTNFTSTVLTNQAAAAVMGETGGGRIINFGSSEGVMGSPMSAIYAASKSAVASWTRSAAKCVRRMRARNTSRWSRSKPSTSNRQMRRAIRSLLTTSRRFIRRSV